MIIMGVIMADPKDRTRTDVANNANGAVWATLLAAGVGGLAFGLITDVSECSASISKHLIWYPPAGALSGVAICAVIIWIIFWGGLHIRWREKRIEAQGKLVAMITFLALAAVVTTFPPFYELFAR
jgi:hypothetical protein